MADEERSWTHNQAIVNGVRLHYVEAGTGPLVILLHGFPEFWYSWRHQIPALAASGFRVIAPDMRGYNVSEKPPDVTSYSMGALVGDVVGLVRHAAAERASIVGHDWGGAVAWSIAMQRPEVVDRLAVINAPHPGAFARELRTPAQLQKSSYMFFFQLPWLPEASLRLGNYAALRRVFRNDPVRPDTFSEEDIERYVEAAQQPGALTATINYYRAAFRHGRRLLLGEFRPIQAPTLLIWGEEDRYLGPELTRGLERWVPNIRIERIPNVSHWVQHEIPERVNQLLIQFLKGEEFSTVRTP